MSPALTKDLVRERLYALLPTIYRMRDFGQGEPLRALLLLLENELLRVESDIARLYDNWFVETCDEWAVPYIGDLIGSRLLHPVHARAFTANSLAHKRRKGTVQTLGALARDITGWPAQAVEYMPLVVTSQHVNSPTARNRATTSLRCAQVLDNIGTPFETTTRSVDVRSRGRFLQNQLGVYVWRADVTRRDMVATLPLSAGVYAVSPLGMPQSLWSPASIRAGLEAPMDLKLSPQPIRRRVLYQSLEARRQALIDGRTVLDPYFDPEPVLRIFYRDSMGNVVAVLPEQMVAADLTTPWRPAPQLTYKRSGDGKPVQRRIVAAVDPELGRVAFATDVNPSKVWTTYYASSMGSIGGGGYERTLREVGNLPVVLLAGGGDQPALTALQDPAQWPGGQVAGQSPSVVIEFGDSDIYTLPLVKVSDGGTLVLRARSQCCPTLLAGDSPLPIQLGNGATLVLDGVHVRGGFVIQPLSGTAPGFSAQVTVRHATLVPGFMLDPAGLPRFPSTPSLSVSNGFPPGSVSVSLEHAISGPIIADTFAVTACDSIIDAPLRASPAVVAGSVQFSRVTVLGACLVTRVLAIKDSVLLDRLLVVDRDSSTFAVTYSVLPYDPTLGQITYRCQPFLSVNEAQTADEKRRLADMLRPQLSASRYGAPGYGQLSVRCATALRSAASDQGEPGAFHQLQQALRESNLIDSQAEYLRSGLTLNLFVVT